MDLDGEIIALKRRIQAIEDGAGRSVAESIGEGDHENLRGAIKDLGEHLSVAGQLFESIQSRIQEIEEKLGSQAASYVEQGSHEELEKRVAALEAVSHEHAEFISDIQDGDQAQQSGDGAKG